MKISLIKIDLGISDIRNKKVLKKFSNEVAHSKLFYSSRNETKNF